MTPSQSLTEEWYNSENHESSIDHCVVPIGAATIVPQLWFFNSSKHGLPEETASGVIDMQLWKQIPELHGHDTNEPTRNGETLKQWGSDHYGFSYYFNVRQIV